MRKNNRLKKGFTLVELVVVIAVIAILGAVSVGAYFGITETANLQAAKTHIKQLNDMLLYSYLLEGNTNNTTAHEARRDVQKQGLDVTTLENFGNYRYGWDSSQDKYVLVDISSKTEEGKYSIKAPEEYETADTTKIFLIASSVNDINDDFSFYLHDNFVVPDNGVVTVTTGIDAGLINLPKIVYNNATDREITVIINNNFYKTEVEINAGTNGSVKHYGYSYKVTINSVAANSYHEFGTIGNINHKKGRLVLEPQSEVFVINHSLSETTVEINSTKRIPNVNPSGNPTCAFDGHHATASKILPDLKDVYRICYHCGKTMNYVGDSKSISEPSPIGWLNYHLDTFNYNNTCGHSFLSSDTGDVTEGGSKITNDTCTKCHFAFFTAEANHFYYPEYIRDESNQITGVVHKCDCGCNTISESPLANVKSLDDAEKMKAFYGVDSPNEKPSNMPLYFIEEQNLGSPGSILNNYIGRLSDYSCGYKFAAVDTAETIEYSSYNGWLADYIITFDRDVGPMEIALWGYFEEYGVGLSFTPNFEIKANLPIPLITSVFGTPYEYYNVVAGVRNFYCGAINLNEKHMGNIVEAQAPTTITVELCILNPAVLNDPEFNQVESPLDILLNPALREAEQYFKVVNLFPHTFQDVHTYIPTQN